MTNVAPTVALGPKPLSTFFPITSIFVIINFSKPFSSWLCEQYPFLGRWWCCFCCCCCLYLICILFLLLLLVLVLICCCRCCCPFVCFYISLLWLLFYDNVVCHYFIYLSTLSSPLLTIIIRIDPEHESVTNVLGSATPRLPRVSPSPNIYQPFSPQSTISFIKSSSVLAQRLLQYIRCRDNFSRPKFGCALENLCITDILRK